MKERRYDIDWLRVLVMLAVFLFHSARFFGGGTWHLNNAEESFAAGLFIGLTIPAATLSIRLMLFISGVIMDSLGVSSIFLTGGVLTIIGVFLVAFFLRGYTPPTQGTSTVNMNV